MPESRIEQARGRRAAKREARQARRKLDREKRDAVDAVTAWAINESNGDPDRAKEMAEQRFTEMGFDPMTILMLVQVAILIYKALKALNVFSPTPEVVAAIFEEDSDA